MAEKVIVGLSGGVDSSVAAYTLLQQGYDVIGVTMHVWGNVDENVAVKDAKKVADHLGIPHYVIDFTKEFKENVVDYFINEYLCGRTPNPCNMCNGRHSLTGQRTLVQNMLQQVIMPELRGWIMVAWLL